MADLKVKGDEMGAAMADLKVKDDDLKVKDDDNYVALFAGIKHSEVQKLDNELSNQVPLWTTDVFYMFPVHAVISMYRAIGRELSMTISAPVPYTVFERSAGLQLQHRT